jgi:hypothetical protein
MHGTFQGAHKKRNWLIFLLFSAPAFSAVNDLGGSLPLPPRASIWGSTGTNTFGEGDVMIPMLGNSDQIFFSDIAAKYGNHNAWFASLGLGGRKIIQNNHIWGAYFFADQNKTPNANYFTVLNPGIEWMSNQWDAHLNGYVPVGSKSKLIDIFTATALGRSPTNYFRRHTQYEPLFDLVESVGPGADFEVGHTFNVSYQKRVRLFAGGYFFDPKQMSHINGIEAGFEMPLRYRQASVEIRDSYDNVNHNTFLLTLRVTFGGLDKTGAPDIHDRMLDRIPRHLANLYNGDGIPSEKKIVDTGRAAILKDNIWFFNADGAPSTVEGFESCTFEHPCFGLAQTQIDTINSLAPNANFYLSSGLYNNPAVGSGFSFYNGQNIFGRTSDFNQLATGSNRPLLNDSLLLNGNNNIYNTRIVANSELNIDTGVGGITPFRTGVLVTTASTGMVNMANTDVVAAANTLNAAAVINNSPTATFSITNSTLTSSLLNIPGGVVIGAGNVSSGVLNISDSSITVRESDVVNNFDIVFGVVNNEQGVVNIANSSITVNASNAGLTAGVLNNSTSGPGIVNIVGANITVLADQSGLAADIFNQANNFAGIGGTVNIDQSVLLLVSNNNGGGLGAGIFNTAKSMVNATNTTISSNGDDGTIVGILNGDPLSIVNLQNNTISVNLSGLAAGAPIFNGGMLNNNGGNQCYQNGVPVPC